MRERLNQGCGSKLIFADLDFAVVSKRIRIQRYKTELWLKNEEFAAVMLSFVDQDPYSEYGEEKGIRYL